MDQEDGRELLAAVGLRQTKGTEVQAVLQPYGIGIDTHSKFIQVCILMPQGAVLQRFDNTFPTTWAALKQARDWAAYVVQAAPGELRYCRPEVESCKEG